MPCRDPCGVYRILRIVLRIRTGIARIIIAGIVEIGGAVERRNALVHAMMAESRIIVLIEGQAHEARAVEERNPVRPSYVIRDVV